MNVALSDQRRGWLCTNEDPEHYYFAPSLALANLQDGDLEETYEVSQNDAKSDAPALVAFRVSGTGARLRARGTVSRPERALTRSRARSLTRSLANSLTRSFTHALSLSSQPRSTCCFTCMTSLWTRTR